MTTASEVFVRALEAHGIDRVFCVPGESFLRALDALRDSTVRVIASRHEGGAGFMAVADARLSGGIGVAMVSRGPGASNAAIAVHTAQQDALPFLLVVGQVERADLQRGAFQEVEYRTMFGSMAKAVFEVQDPERMGELLAQACHEARVGLPGPVVVAIPEDVFEAQVAEPSEIPCFPVNGPGIDRRKVAAVAERLANSRRPLVVAGGELDSEPGRRNLRRLADAWAVPVAASLRQSDLLDNHHSAFVGHLSYAANRDLVERLADCDLLLAIGTRLGDVTSQGYSFPRAPQPDQAVIQVHGDARQLARVRSVELGVVADCAEFCGALAEAAPESVAWLGWRDRLHAAQREWTQWHPHASDDGVVFGAVVAAVDRHLSDGAIVVSDAGNFGGWLNRYLPITRGCRFIGPISGAMGYGVPGAVAAALRHPDRKIVCFVGDGGMLMTGAELATASAFGAELVVIVSDNGAYGTIRLHQEKRFPGRPVATALANPDFALYGRAFGATVFEITEESEIEPAIAAAMKARGSVLVHVRSSLDHISPGVRLSELGSE